MPFLSLLLVAAGILLLFGGGEGLVRGATSIAQRFGMSSLVVGLTVVAFATSAPELAASLTAALTGAPDIAVGNVLGSNVANLALILGVAALARPIPVAASFVKGEIPVMIVVTLLLAPMLLDDLIGRGEGVLLLLVLALYLGFLLVQKSRTGGAGVSESLQESPLPLRRAILAVGLGGLGLVVGAKLLITGAVEIAQSFGISDRVIGLTLVALGTSLPELASSLVAARHGEGDIVLGNIIGSNVFNVACILGTTAVVIPIPAVDPGTPHDLAVVVGLSIALPLLLLPNGRLGRVAGGLLLLAYGLYVGVLFAGF
ncbi:MAG: calcium/sodium antiporter [Thermoanaerobaculia bacterium]|nr:calcium/sodium antiporter [Thermoanaerobaculia bacterium]